MDGVTEGQIIAALATVVVSLVGGIVRMAFHIRDLNKTLTVQAETHGKQAAAQASEHATAIYALQEAWREEANERADKTEKLLLHTNRTLDAVLRSKGLEHDANDTDSS